MKKNRTTSIVCNVFFILFSITFIVPFLYIISISLTDESYIIQHGYSLFPKQFSVAAYSYVFANMTQLINSYVVTIISSLTVAIGGTFIMSLLAYPLSVKDFAPRRIITFLVFFTMLFGGGMMASYIINTQVLGLGDSIWIYILPSLVTPYYVIILRSNFAGLPTSLVEAAEIDGAGEYRIFFQIVVPLSKPVLATVALLTLLAKWNDWTTAMIYIRNNELYSLQYLLQKYLNEAAFLKQMSDVAPANMTASITTPSESLKFAMVVIATGPALLLYPFFQKYFAKGMTIGAVKG